jgi:hypothetical protein
MVNKSLTHEWVLGHRRDTARNLVPSNGLRDIHPVHAKDLVVRVF